MISKTGNTPSKLGMVVIGLAEIVDGLIAVLSLGYLTSSFSFIVLAYIAKKEIMAKYETDRHEHCNHTPIDHEQLGWSCDLWPVGGPCCGVLSDRQTKE